MVERLKKSSHKKGSIMIHTYANNESSAHDKDVEAAIGKLQDGEDMLALFTFNIKTQGNTDSAAIVDEKHIFKFMEKLDLNCFVSYYVYEITANGVGRALTSDGVWNAVFTDEQEAIEAARAMHIADAEEARSYVLKTIDGEKWTTPDNYEPMDLGYELYVSQHDHSMPDEPQMNELKKLHEEVEWRHLHEHWTTKAQHGVYDEYWRECDTETAHRRAVFEVNYYDWYMTQRSEANCHLDDWELSENVRKKKIFRIRSILNKTKLEDMPAKVYELMFPC